MVKDQDGNIKSVKVVKSNNSGKIVKDGKVVKSWGDDDADEDAQKMIEKVREELKSAGVDVPDFECCGTACGKGLLSAPDASAKAKIEKAKKAKAAERKANKAKIDETKKAKAAERKAMQDEIDELRKELAELKKQLATEGSSK